MFDFLAMQEAAAQSEPVALPDDAAANLDARLGPYRVGPGDVLQIQMIGGDRNDIHPAINARVNRTGDIALPTVGSLHVLNLELEDVEHTIQAAYVPAVYRDMVVHVEVLRTESTDVLVVGAVTAPGLVPLRRTEQDMLHAIVAAGGVNELASGRATLRRVRTPGDPVTFDLTQPYDLQRALAEAPLQDGDIIEVHAEQPNTVFVGGLVRRVGPQHYPTGTSVTVLQVLAAAGGLRTELGPKEGTLVRRLPDGSDVHVKLNLDRLARGQDPNITLAAGDIIWVPDTIGTRVAEFLNNNLFFRAGVSVNYSVTGVEFLNRRSAQSARLSGSSLQDSFDPLGFLGQNAALQNLTARP